MIFIHILFPRTSTSITDRQLLIIAIISLSLVTGGRAQQSTTLPANGLVRRDSSPPPPIPKGANFEDSARIAFPDDPEVSSNPSGIICGTVTDENGDIIPGATVMLDAETPTHRETAIASDAGFFQFTNVAAGASYYVRVHAEGFADWSSQALHIDPGHVLFLTNVALRLEGASVSVTVSSSTPEQLATEQVHIAEHQRVLGFIPNFFVVYDPNPVPLTTKLKFKLALRVAVDPVTLFGVATMAGIDQAASTPNYVEGVKGYGQRAGALYADAFTDTMLAGAILPSLLHQDPRYFYQGTGTIRSRLRHALFSPFVCKGDNGRWQPNYSSLAGNLGTTAMSELYYPRSNRGYGLVFGNFLIGTGERMVSGIAQEFLLRRLTPAAAKNH